MGIYETLLNSESNGSFVSQNFKSIPAMYRNREEDGRNQPVKQLLVSVFFPFRS